MQIQISRTELLCALARVQGIVERRPTTRLAAHILLEAGEAGLAVSATDPDISLTGQYSAKVLANGAITANAKQLYDIVRALPAGEVDIARADQNWLTLRCGKSEFRVAGGPADEFPALFEVDSEGEVPLPTGTFLQMIDRTLFCVSTDENRHNLAGVFCEAADDGTLRMVSTDGHRLAMAEGAVERATALAAGVLMPRKGLTEARRLLAETHGEGEVRLGVHEQGMVLRFDRATLTIRLIEASFPDYRQVIPQSSSKEAIIDRAPFAEALKRVSLLSQSRTFGVRLQFSADELLLVAEDPEHGDARESLPIAYSGEPLNIGFNARYILDVLALSGGRQVVFALTDEHSPGVLKPSEDASFLSIVMPMRV